MLFTLQLIVAFSVCVHGAILRHVLLRYNIPTDQLYSVMFCYIVICCIMQYHTL